MKKSSVKVLSVIIGASVVFAGCNGLGKMVKKAGTVSYEVSPKPLEMHGDSVAITISGKYPEKYFAKKAVLTLTPAIKWQGGEKALKPVTLIGEKAEGTGTKISYAGGTFMYKDIVAYQPEMKRADLVIKGTGAVKSKTKEFPETKVADGTIVTPLLVKSDEKPLLGADKFTKTYPVSQTASIYYVVNQSTVRPGEMNNDEMKAMKEFIATGVTKGYTFKNTNVSAYASPDGEQSLNADLAGDRAKSGSKALMAVFKDKKTKVAAGAEESFYTTVTTAEDWDGFKKAMEASSIPDKDLILRVLTMYSDLDVREKEIKNLSKTYLEISDKILPKLRRSVLTLNADVNSRTDAQIQALVKMNSDSLSVEEILYAATLTNDMNEKLSIYKMAEAKYPNDWRGINNAGYIYVLQNKVNDAGSQFEKANKISTNNQVILNNMGIVARWKGDRAAAEEYYKAATGAGAEVGYNLGILYIMKGDYASAVSSFGSFNSFNTALAKVLNGSPNDALAIIDASTDKDAALSFYLKAVVGARTKNKDLMINNLKAAINKDASYKNMAKDDCEFLNYRADADFTSLTN